MLANIASQIPPLMVATGIALTIWSVARVNKHGGLTFWRLGRLGGSVYFAKPVQPE